MAFPARTRLTFSGIVGSALNAPLEQWSFNLSLPQTALAGLSQVAMDGFATGMKDAYNATLNTNSLDSNTFLTGVRAAIIGVDGKYVRNGDGSYAMGNWVGGTAGGKSPAGYPLQTALVASLKTARSGATGKGRIFLPWPGFAIGSSTRTLTATQALVVANDVAQLIHNINVAMGSGLKVVVASSKGYLSDVTGVRVGVAPDTQRSRRSNLVEGYVNATTTI